MKGYFVAYMTVRGEQKGIVCYDKQLPKFQKQNKCLVTLLNPDFTPKLDERGKEISFLMKKETLKIYRFC
jgi:hypothetical protein